MSKIDIIYHNLLNKILQEGYTYEDPNRKGINRIEIPSYTFRHEFKDGFPAITTKKLHYKNVVTELLWFLRGDTNIKYLVDNGCNIWNKDAFNYYKKLFPNTSLNLNKFKEYVKDEVSFKYEGFYKKGDLGPVYGHQWRKWSNNKPYWGSPIDQIQKLITNLKEKPLATDHIVNSWNVGDLENMALPPCHYGFQIVVRPLSFWERVDLLYKPGAISTSGDLELILEELDESDIPKYGFELHWNQRSVDTFLGLPYNIASYATLALIIEKITGYKALAIQGDLKKVHLYDNSLDAVKEQLSRDPNKYNNCKLYGANLTELMDDFDNKPFNLDEFISELEPDDIYLVDYESYSAINVEMLERNE